MARIWVADNEPNERMTLYTRANVGEVFPHVLHALTATLIGPAVQQAQVEVMVELGVLRPKEVTGTSCGTGVFGGYLYSNATGMRLFAVRMPGIDVSAADEQVFGATVLPPYVRSKGDRNLIASLQVTRTTLRMFRRPDLSYLDEARDGARAWLATMPDLGTAEDTELIAWLRAGYPPRIGASMKRLLQCSMVAAAPRSLLDRILDRPDVPPGLANRVVAGTDDVDSAQLGQRLWDLGRIVAGDPALTAAFDAGLDGIRERTTGTALDTAVSAFLADHGHRGNDEYELATPSWQMDPTPVYATIDRLRHVPAERDPHTTIRRVQSDAAVAFEEVVAAAPRLARRFVRRCVGLARSGSIARERAKDILVLENLGARLVLHELVRRAAERGGPADVRRAFCITIDELTAYLADPARFADVIEERAVLRDYLNEREPPSWFDGHISDPSTWPRRVDADETAPGEGSVLSGIGVSVGSASGPAKVIEDPADPRGLDAGEILVCRITDPSWTPLFLGAAAVVCETGAVQSHASIVSRELGIPAVMSVVGITSIPDGTELHVDGTTGTVTVGAATGS